jgi:hypothetical protein
MLTIEWTSAKISLLFFPMKSITATSGLEVEIKSYHNCFRRDMEHYALCVLMGRQLACLSLKGKMMK